MRLTALIIVIATGGLLALPGSQAVATRGSDIALLQPGTTYVSSFSLNERQEACRFLEISEGTSAFDHCLEGDFPQNPWFSR
jgi:hypothetical protein